SQAEIERRKTPADHGNVIGSNQKREPRRRPGERYTVTSYARAIKNGCDKGFPPPAELLDPTRKSELAAWRKAHHWHPHQLRHAAASELRKTHGIEAASTL